MRAQPEDDLFFLLVDVTTPEGLDHWMRDLQDGRNVTVLAEEGGKLLGYSSLHHGQARWTRHLGEIRLLMAPDQRGRGVGRLLRVKQKTEDRSQKAGDACAKIGYTKRRMSGQSYSVHGRQAAEVPMWQELLVGIELVQLRLTSVFYGLGVPHGHGEAVILIPGFLGTDAYLGQLFSWLRTVGYRSYFSGIGWNAECPNLLIRRRLNETVKRACNATGQRVHLVGHSLGGIIARSVAAQRPDRGRFGHHIRLSVPRNGGAPQRAAGQRRHSQWHPARACRPHSARLLHRRLHVRVRLVVEGRIS